MSSLTARSYYASARAGFAKKDLDDPEVDMSPLFETIINYIPAPEGDPDAETQVLISTIDYNEYRWPYRCRQDRQRYP